MFSADFPRPAVVTSLHNHSTWSDGGDTLENMCINAKKSGIRVFGMSDHLVFPPCPLPDSESWSMKVSEIGEYLEQIKAMKQRLEDGSFTLLAGLEVDFFHENKEEIRELLASLPLDYAIGSVHYTGKFPVDHDFQDWANLTQQEIDGIWDSYWDKLLGCAKSGIFQILGHIDLPKKFGCMASVPQLNKAQEVLEAAKASSMIMEINTAGWDKMCRAPYPDLDILKVARKLEIPVVVSADAHAVSQLTRHFDQAEELLATAGY